MLNGIILLLSTTFSLNLYSSDFLKVVYGDDNRSLIEHSKLSKFKLKAKSVAAMMYKDQLDELYDGLIYKQKMTRYSDYEFTDPDTGDKDYLCKDSKYYNQPKLSTCSGFLVAEDLLVTAGHCVQDPFVCEGVKWVFDYSSKYIQEDSDSVYFDGDNVYGCKEIISSALRVDAEEFYYPNDYTLIRLDRKVKDRSPLKYRTKERVENGVEVVVIGHPSGLPTIITDRGVIKDSFNPYFFSTDSDVSEGSSGSPVFNLETGLVEGIQVQGEEDFKYNFEKKCYEVKKCKEYISCEGEDVTRITVIPELTPDLAPAKPDFYDFINPNPKDKILSIKESKLDLDQPLK